MAKKEEKNVVDETLEETEEVVEEAPKGKNSEAKKAFATLIEAYKKQNPAKYELKKDELQKKLDAIK